GLDVEWRGDEGAAGLVGAAVGQPQPAVVGDHGPAVEGQPRGPGEAAREVNAVRRQSGDIDIVDLVIDCRRVVADRQAAVGDGDGHGALEELVVGRGRAADGQPPLHVDGVGGVEVVGDVPGRQVDEVGAVGQGDAPGGVGVVRLLHVDEA